MNPGFWLIQKDNLYPTNNHKHYNLPDFCISFVLFRTSLPVLLNLPLECSSIKLAITSHLFIFYFFILIRAYIRILEQKCLDCDERYLSLVPTANILTPFTSSLISSSCHSADAALAIGSFSFWSLDDEMTFFSSFVTFSFVSTMFSMLKMELLAASSLFSLFWMFSFSDWILYRRIY